LHEYRYRSWAHVNAAKWSNGCRCGADFFQAPTAASSAWQKQLLEAIARIACACSN
jgi:hypothetical protein